MLREECVCGFGRGWLGGCEALKQHSAGVLYIGWRMQAGSSPVSHNHRASVLGQSGTSQTIGGAVTEGKIVGRWKGETSGLYDCLRQGQK